MTGANDPAETQNGGIVRMWHGRTRARDIDAYRRYVEQTGLADYRRCPGNLGAVVLTRVDGEIAEIVTLSFWESMDAVRRFAGDEPETARYYPEDERYLLEFEPNVRHFEMFPSSVLTPAPCS